MREYWITFGVIDENGETQWDYNSERRFAGRDTVQIMEWIEIYAKKHGYTDWGVTR